MGTPRVRRRWVCLALCGVGLTASAYLLARHIQLQGEHGGDGSTICELVFGASCDESLLSPISKQLGIPLAGWGVVYYATLAVLLLEGWLLGKTFAADAARAALLLAVSGVAGSVTLTVVMAVGAAPFCPFCMVVHVVNLALLPVIWRLNAGTLSEHLRAVRAAGAWLLGGRTARRTEVRWKLVGFIVPALLAVAVYQWARLQETQAAPENGFDPYRVLADYVAAEPQDIPIDADDPRLGEGPIRLVVFSSFECPACRVFSGRLRALGERFGKEVSIFYKHFPLGKACNPRVGEDKYPRACKAAWSAEAARRQGGFWPFHDALFASELSGSDAIDRIAADTGLEVSRLVRDRDAEDVKAKVRSDIELGIRLGLEGTPAVFLNQRRVRHLSVKALEALITQVYFSQAAGG